MRLHRLQLSAFGPFSGEVDVDLERLGADGLFLLHGDTGAGKTTLLDAVAFALFGRVPGARNEAKRLRCDRADSGTRTFVRLEATLGGHRVEIARSPAYFRPKARGTGLTEEKHKVHLRWLDAPTNGAGADGLTRAEEVGQTVIDLLGMSADQFFQVVLLPQGDFARFLRSDTAEREVLLERLFDTGRFGTIEEWFAAARRESGARVKERRDLIGRLTARVAEAAGTREDPGENLAAWLADLRDRAADQSALAAVSAAAAATAGQLADRNLREVRQQADRVHRVRVLTASRAELERAAGERASWRRAISAWTEAAPVIAAAESATEQAQRTRKRQTEVNELRTVAEGLVAPAEDVPKLSVDLRSVSAVTREQAGSLAGLVRQSHEQDDDKARLAVALEQRRAVVRQLESLDRLIGGMPAEVEQLAGRVELARAAVQRAAVLAEQEVAERALMAAAESVASRDAEERAAAAARAAAVDAHQDAVGTRQQLVERRIHGMAAELAANLRAGEGCPVCGSDRHPRPANPGIGAVTATQISAAEQAERAAAARRDVAAVRLQTASVAAAQARTSAMGHTVEQAAARWTAISRELQDQRVVAATLHPLQLASRAAQAGLQDAAAERHAQQIGKVRLDTEIDQLTAAISGRAERLGSACAGYPDVAFRRDHLLALATALDRLAAASEKLDAAEVGQSESTTALVLALAESPFRDLAAARAAAEIDQPALSKRLRDAEDELTGITAQLADPDLAGVNPNDEPDVPTAEAVARLARSAVEAAVTAAASTAAKRDQIAAAASRLAEAQRELEPELAADSELAALTDVILGRGQNARAISLRTYVLAAKLAQVAVSAGQRLAAMSGGRYTFVQSQEKESRGRSGGLGLDIFDAFSGLVRPAKTLSGGESFLASLSLALGLADVVAAESGGRQLDTMFIDEGFGSLDADTLDLVMGTLDELRAGGRTVGLVSHVEELRQRIPSRLRITRTPAGSELEMSTA